jgi:metal transporter CNNM
MMPEFFVVIVSVALILFFGEILPSAVFIGHNQLAIASTLSPLVHVIMWIVYPIAYPIAKLLDCVVPHDGCAMNYYTRNELAALIRLQYEARMAERQAKVRQRQAMTMTKKANVASSPMACFVRSGSSDNEDNNNNHQVPSSPSIGNSIHSAVSLDLDEVIMAEGALALRSRKVADLVIPRKKVFSISYDAELTEEMIVHIFASGYSRVPVYRGQNPKQICGILMTRELILVKASDRKKVGDLPLHTARCISPNMDLVALVNLFQTGGGVGVMGRTRRSAGHMAIVCAKPDLANDALQHQADDGRGGGDPPIPPEAGLIGIITMEDVLEALLQEQIYDETDAAGRRISMRGTDSTSVSTAGTAGRRPGPQHSASSSSIQRHPLPPPSTTTASAADATSYYSALL